MSEPGFTGLKDGERIREILKIIKSGKTLSEPGSTGMSELGFSGFKDLQDFSRPVNLLIL
jgi:hypothetical protein